MEKDEKQPAVAGDQGVSTSASGPASEPTVPAAENPFDKALEPGAQVGDWSPEDEVWVAHVPQELQPIARRHGRPLFQIVMQAGTSTHALGILSRQTAGNRAAGQALGVLVKCLDDLCRRAALGTGKPLAAFAECKADIERIASLAGVGQSVPDGARVSKGGIILNS